MLRVKREIFTTKITLEQTADLIYNKVAGLAAENANFLRCRIFRGGFALWQGESSFMFIIISETFISAWAMIILLLIFAGLSVPDIFRRHFLSKGAVLYITMFFAPLAVCISIGTAVLGVIGDNPAWKKILIFAGSAALFLISAVVYVRGHFYPTDKSADYGVQKKLIGARRLILIGLPSSLLYSALAVVILVEFITLVLPLLGGSLSDFLATVGTLLIGLLIPLFNIFVFIYLLMLGTELTYFGAALLMAFLQCLLITNGCIRYIVTENIGKVEKGLFIFLALFPGINFIMGIRYCVKISKKLKEK